MVDISQEFWGAIGEEKTADKEYTSKASWIAFQLTIHTVFLFDLHYFTKKSRQIRCGSQASFIAFG